MDDLEHLQELQRLIGQALCAGDPESVLLPALSAEQRQAVDVDGLKLTVLLVARLRFERLVQGSKVAGEWFDRDPRSFSHAFKRYHGSVAPVAMDPWAEADLFERWLKDDAPTPGT